MDLGVWHGTMDLCVLGKAKAVRSLACLVQKLLLYTQRSVYGALLVPRTA